MLRRKPGFDQLFYMPGDIRIEIHRNRKVADFVELGWTLAEGAGHFQCIHDVKVVRPRFGKIFPRMRGRIGRDEPLLPV